MCLRRAALLRTSQPHSRSRVKSRFGYVVSLTKRFWGSSGTDPHCPLCWGRASPLLLLVPTYALTALMSRGSGSCSQALPCVVSSPWTHAHTPGSFTLPLGSLSPYRRVTAVAPCVRETYAPHGGTSFPRIRTLTGNGASLLAYVPVTCTGERVLTRWTRTASVPLVTTTGGKAHGNAYDKRDCERGTLVR